MEVSFPFERRASAIFGEVWRPLALVEFRVVNQPTRWITIRLIVDTGADYTLLPRSYARVLGVDLERDCQAHPTLGIGGQENVFLHTRIGIRIADWTAEIPVGFLDRDAVPPLLGRQHCLEALTVSFENHTTRFRFS